LRRLKRFSIRFWPLTELPFLLMTYFLSFFSYRLGAIGRGNGTKPPARVTGFWASGPLGERGAGDAAFASTVCQIATGKTMCATPPGIPDLFIVRRLSQLPYRAVAQYTIA